MVEHEVSRKKFALRKCMREKREHVSPELRYRAAESAALLFHRQVLPKYQSFAAYYPLPHEMDTLPILKMCFNANKDLFLPKINVTSGFLTFHRIHTLSNLIAGGYGIAEPPATACEVELASLDVMLVPALAIDVVGNRLGMGGGFYDRTLATSGGRRRPLLLAYVYAWQRVAEIAREPWDVAVDGVLTESELHFFTSQ